MEDVLDRIRRLIAAIYAAFASKVIQGWISKLFALRNAIEGCEPRRSPSTPE